MRLAGGGLVKVVGESHYQPALARATGRRVEWETPIRVAAVLVPDPGNRYDQYAVRVDVDGQCVGYLPASLAGEYQPELLTLGLGGRLGWCEGRILGGGQHQYGIHLALDQPRFLRPLNEPGDLHILDARTTVTVTGGRAIQAPLHQLAAALRCDIAGSMWAELRTATAATGTHAGNALLSVHVDGLEIGSLSQAMSARYLPVVATEIAGGHRPGCLAYLRLHDAMWRMLLQLPELAG